VGSGPASVGSGPAASGVLLLEVGSGPAASGGLLEVGSGPAASRDTPSGGFWTLEGYPLSSEPAASRDTLFPLNLLVLWGSEQGLWTF
jgi:hypothetical protein